MSARVGDTIRIIDMQGEPQYSGKIGVVRNISVDPWGDTAMYGTWGGLSVYEGKDRYEVIKQECPIEKLITQSSRTKSM